MRHCFCVWMAAFLLLIVSGHCQAQKQSAAPSVADKGTRATALVVDHAYRAIKGRQVAVDYMGSAFCISDQGYYITNAHVVFRRPVGASVRISIWNGLYNPAEFEAIIVHKDKGHDLALLKIEKRAEHHPLALASSTDPLIGTPVVAFGFPGGYRKEKMSEVMPLQDGRLPGEPRRPDPFESLLPDGFPRRPRLPSFPNPDPYPMVMMVLPPLSVTSGHITNLIDVASRFRVIESTAKVNFGSSGGPLLNRKGEVIGVVTAIERGTGRCIAIPTRALKRFLALPDIASLLDRPTIRLDPSSIPAGQQARACLFVVKLTHADGVPFKTDSGLSVSLALNTPGLQRDRIALKPATRGEYTVQAVPVPTNSEPHYVTLTARQDGHATFYYHVKDQAVHIGDETVLLSHITHIRRGASPSALLVDGREQPGSVTGLELLPLPERALPNSVKLNTAQSISVTDLTSTPHVVDYSIQVKSGGHLVTEKMGQITMTDAVPRRVREGMVVACADEWPTNSTGSESLSASELTASTRQYIRNIADLFTMGAPGRFLICTDHWTFGRPFQETLRAAGHTVIVSVRPDNFKDYDFPGFDGVFVSGRGVDGPTLVRYVKQGGRVYVGGGCGSNDPALWNPFLNAFGISMRDASSAEVWRVMPEFDMPLFAGVKELKMTGVSPLDKLPGVWPNTYLAAVQFGDHLWAIYTTDNDVVASTSNVP